MTFAFALVFFCTLHYLVRLRSIPEDDIREHRHDASERRQREHDEFPGRS